MRKHFLLCGLAAGIISLAASGAEAQGRYKPRSSDPNAPDPTQMSIDVSQYSPEAQMGKVLRNTEMLVQQNQQLTRDLSTAMQKIDELEGRLRSISNVLTTGSGELIGSMVHKIKNKVAGPY
jgi:hypothetical protein